MGLQWVVYIATDVYMHFVQSGISPASLLYGAEEDILIRLSLPLKSEIFENSLSSCLCFLQTLNVSVEFVTDGFCKANEVSTIKEASNCIINHFCKWSLVNSNHWST